MFLDVVDVLMLAPQAPYVWGSGVASMQHSTCTRTLPYRRGGAGDAVKLIGSRREPQRVDLGDAVSRPPRGSDRRLPGDRPDAELFYRLGYDSGMIMYGAAEPEFSVRAWLSGAEVRMVPQLRVEHALKPTAERQAFIRSVRLDMVCNGLRFGLLYASEAGALQLLRYYSLKFPNLFDEALARVQSSDVWGRRAHLKAELPRPFPWFVEHLNLKDQAGGEIT